MTQPTVFISYSHKDEQEKDKLLSHLGVLQHAGKIDLWSDDRIKAGSDWEQEISQTMAEARIAILLVTANFLTSNFILTQEVPALLKRHQNEGLVVFPIIAQHCAWDAVDWLRKMNVRPKNGAPVWRGSGRYADEELTKIAREVADIFKEAQTRQVHLFISYKRNVKSDEQLAIYLHEFLTKEGHEVFIDRTLRTGDAWLEQIDQQIKASDFLVVLLSKESADSEMVQAEVSRAYEYRRLQGKPATLSVRMGIEGLLPYSIAAYLGSLQYVTWNGESDNERVSQELLAAIQGRLPQQAPTEAKPGAKVSIISEDGRPVTDDNTLQPPLPEFDPRFVAQLEAPGGAVKLRDKLYIEREADNQLKREIVKWGSTTTIRAPRQTGKTSLLMRGLHHARKNKAKAISIDFQSFGHDKVASPDIFLRELAEMICHELRLDPAGVEGTWRGSLGAQNKLTYYLEDYVLPKFKGPLILAMDEADCLLQTDFYQDFFGLVRSWHNRRARYDEWEKLNIVMVISTEPFLLIDDINQSPFNVGLKLELADFTESQVRELNRRHHSPVTENDFPKLMTLLNGHPYLTRKALYTLITEQSTWADLMRIAATDDGPFADHLRRHHWGLRDKPELEAALRQIIRENRCPDDHSLLRLLRAGLIKGSGDAYTCRCDLYRQYFEDKLF